jgi:hypothetical protein
MRKLFPLTLVWGLLFANLSLAAPWSTVVEKLVTEKFSGTWASDKNWKGWLCKGSYRYEAEAKGEVFDADYVTESETVALLKTEIRDIDVLAKGTYRASKTLCIPFRLGIRVRVDNFWAQVRVKVSGPSMKKISVRILETKFGGLHFGESTPPAIEKFITKVVNVSLHSLWSSWLGGWISEKISPDQNEIQ